MPTKNITLTPKQHTDLTSARANLYCVLTQSCDSDDQILMDGVRRALALLDGVEAEITDECATTTDSDLSDRHGGPKDRGRADAYYGRPKNPHKYAGNTGTSECITLSDPVEFSAYNDAYDGEPDRKNWD
jgi:hypothetical protein